MPRPWVNMYLYMDLCCVSYIDNFNFTLISSALYSCPVETSFMHFLCIQNEMNIINDWLLKACWFLITKSLQILPPGVWTQTPQPIFMSVFETWNNKSGVTVWGVSDLMETWDAWHLNLRDMVLRQVTVNACEPLALY